MDWLHGQPHRSNTGLCISNRGNTGEGMRRFGYPYIGFMLQGKYARETENCDAEGDSFMTSFI
jgi:hypothetical protein